MSVVILVPRFDHPAIEERYGAWQSRLLLSRDAGEPVVTYEPEQICSKMELPPSDHVLVATDPLVVPGPGLTAQLVAALGADHAAFAALPVSNEATHPNQRVAPPEVYLTLRQFQQTASQIAAGGRPPAIMRWNDSDPGLFLCSTTSFREHQSNVRSLLSGRRVLLVRSAYVHRWASHRGQARLDLLNRISGDARSILEFGCGEGALGQALKQRQQCRVVGIEIDPQAARVAREKLDAVHSGDVRQVVGQLGETFDWIVGGDALEHLEEPWTFLQQLKTVSTPGGFLILSLPNLGSWPIVSDLLRGRFDYVHLGILCAGHLRFFTRQTIQDMLEMAGWTVESIVPQAEVTTAESKAFFAAMNKAGLEYVREELGTTGYYVIARNGS